MKMLKFGIYAREFRFVGSVQGVGFRWTAKNLADGLNLSGFVKNNLDGSVTLTVRGGNEAIDSLMNELSDGFGPHIVGLESRDVPAGTIPEGFAIVR